MTSGSSVHIKMTKTDFSIISECIGLPYPLSKDDDSQVTFIQLVLHSRQGNFAMAFCP